jgi:transcriptional regulator with XRE-family HTH domain
MLHQTPFNNFIKARRQELNLSLKAASDRTGIQPSRLHDLEQGVSSTTRKPTAPTRENIKRIARGYGVAEDFLLDLAGRPKLDAADEDERRLLSHFRELVPGHKAAVLGLVDQLFRMDHTP